MVYVNMMPVHDSNILTGEPATAFAPRVPSRHRTAGFVFLPPPPIRYRRQSVCLLRSRFGSMGKDTSKILVQTNAQTRFGCQCLTLSKSKKPPTGADEVESVGVDCVESVMPKSSLNFTWQETES